RRVLLQEHLGPEHLDADLEDLLSEVESRPTLGSELGMLCHGASQLQRNRRRASAKLTRPQASRIAMRASCEGRLAPSRITARRASLSAVSGSARTTGWIASGKREAEKNTPERTNIGSITRFIRPETVSILRARLATRRPMPEKLNAPRKDNSTTCS